MRFFLPVSFFTLACLLGCGSDAPAAGAGGSAPNDGKLHPATNGVLITSAAACAKLANAVSAKLQALGCVGTSPSCPGADSQKGQCDDGATTGCVAYYDASTTCKEIQTASNGCVVACK